MWILSQSKDLEALTFIKNFKNSNFIVYIINILWNEYMMFSVSRYFRWKLIVWLYLKERVAPKGGICVAWENCPHCFISWGGEWLSCRSLYHSLLNFSCMCDTFFLVISYKFIMKKEWGKKISPTSKYLLEQPTISLLSVNYFS